jgi:hypothetical protein
MGRPMVPVYSIQPVGVWLSRSAAHVVAEPAAVAVVYDRTVGIQGDRW